MSWPTKITVLPYISLNQPLSFGGWVLWPNTSKNWVRYVGRDLTLLLQPYQGRNGKAVGARATVLHREDNIQHDPFEARALIAVLSTLDWLFDRPSGTSSEHWFSETFLLPDVGRETNPYMRRGKFSEVFANPTTDRVHPSLFAHPHRFLVAQYPAALEGFAREFTRPRDESVLGAMEHWFRARNESETHAGPFADIEAIWAGFESFFHFPRHAGEREQALLGCIRSELDGLTLDEAGFWGPAAEWCRRTYSVRCAQTHGGALLPTDLILQPSGVPLFNAGLKLAAAVLQFRIVGEIEIHRLNTEKELRHLFSKTALIDDVCSRLNVERKKIFPGEDNAENDVSAITNVLGELLQFEGLPAAFVGAQRVLKAADKIALVLSAWSKHLCDTAHPDQEFLLQLHTVISANALKATTPEARIKAVVELARDLVNDPEEVWISADAQDSTPTADSIRGGWTPWQWARGMIRLYEIFIGYAVH